MYTLAIVKTSVFVASIIGLMWLANVLVDSWYPAVAEVQQTAAIMAYNELEQPVPTNSMIRLHAKFPGTRAIQGDRMNVSLVWFGDRQLRLIAIEIVDEGAANKTSFARVLDPPTQMEQVGHLDLVWSIGQPAKRMFKIITYFDEADPRYAIWLQRASAEGIGSYSINGTRYPNFIGTASFSYVSIDQFASSRIWLERILVSGLFVVFPFLTLFQLGGRLGIERKTNLPKARYNHMLPREDQLPATNSLTRRPSQP